MFNENQCNWGKYKHECSHWSGMHPLQKWDSVSKSSHTREIGKHATVAGHLPRQGDRFSFVNNRFLKGFPLPVFCGSCCTYVKTLMSFSQFLHIVKENLRKIAMQDLIKSHHLRILEFLHWEPSQKLSPIHFGSFITSLILKVHL